MAVVTNSNYRKYDPDVGDIHVFNGAVKIGGPVESTDSGGKKFCFALHGSIEYDVADPFTESLGTIPAGAKIIGTIVHVETTFNAGTTNVLEVGDSSTANLLVGANDVDETQAGTTLVGKVVDVTEDTEILAKYTQTGDAATQGKANITVLFLL